MEFKLSIGDKASKKAYKAVLSGQDAEKLIGKKISDKFKGELLGLHGYELEITGGSDSAGFPMRAELDGPGRRKIIIPDSVGFHPERKDQKKRRTLRGNTISEQTVQINCKVVSSGKEPLAKLLGVEAKEEGKAEAPKEESEEEAPREEAKPEDKSEAKKPEHKPEHKPEEKKQ